MGGESSAVDKMDKFCDDFATIAVHAGSEADKVTGAVIPPISVATTFKQDTPHTNTGFEYTRGGNPGRRNLEHAVAAVEGGKHGVAFGSGCAATTAVAMSLPRDSHVLCVNDVYGGTFRFFTKIAPTLGLTCDLVELAPDSQGASQQKDSAAAAVAEYAENTRKLVSKGLRENTSLVWIETPTNPTLRVIDVRAVCEAVREFFSKAAKRALVLVDNTFLTPYLQRPLDLGADVVVHSGTKYISGHSDALIGFVVTSNDEFTEKLRFISNATGGVPGALECFLTHRGLKTLHLRVQRHSDSALHIAKALKGHHGIKQVIYPGLPEHPGYATLLAQSTKRGFGGMISLKLDPAVHKSADAFVTKLRLFTLASSLGGVESLVCVPSVMTHGALTAEQKALLGLDNNFVRLSVGVEDPEDLLKDIKQALDSAAGAVASSASKKA